MMSDMIQCRKALLSTQRADLPQTRVALMRQNDVRHGTVSERIILYTTSTSRHCTACTVRLDRLATSQKETCSNHVNLYVVAVDRQNTGARTQTNRQTYRPFSCHLGSQSPLAGPICSWVWKKGGTDAVCLDRGVQIPGICRCLLCNWVFFCLH